MFFISRHRYLALIAALLLLLGFVTFVSLLAATVVSVILIALLTYPLLIVWHKHHYRPADNYHKVFHLAMGNNVNLGICYYKPTVSSHTPVILCHGIATNHNFYDLTDYTSLAHYLANAGYDVYSLDLRGAGFSRAGKQGFTDFQFEDLVDDIEQVIEAVLKDANRRSKQNQVAYIGHSLGAMIMYRYLELNPRSKVKTFIGLSGPTHISSLAHPVITDFLKFSRFANRVDIKKAGQIFAPLAGILPSRYDDFLYNKHAIDRRALKILMAHGISNVAPSLSKQLLNTLFSRSNELEFDMTKVKVPTFLITGTYDNLCTPLDLQLAYQRLGVPPADKRLLLLGKLYGYRVDYCHGSIIMGKYAYDDVFPAILNWLKEYT